MARRNQNPRKAAMRKMMGEFLKENDISLKDGADINTLMREMMAALIEETLDGELDDKLGYDRYDYENKETDNSRLFQQLGIIYSTVSKSSFITALYIVFVPVIELLLGKKVNQKIWLSVGIAIAGLYFLCMNSVSGINIGDLFLLCGAFVFALQIIAIDRYAGKCDPLTLTFYHRQWLPAWP